MLMSWLPDPNCGNMPDVFIKTAESGMRAFSMRVLLLGLKGHLET